MEPTIDAATMRKYFSKFGYRKIEISGNKNPISMDKFLSFLLVNVKRRNDNLGYDNGWTQLTGSNSLIIGGGWVNKVEYLNSIQYKNGLDCSSHGYVNVFYIFDLLSDEGKKFFLDYYKEDIQKHFQSADEDLRKAEQVVLKAAQAKKELLEFWDSFGGISPIQGN